MKNPSKTKNIIIAVAVILILAAVYFYFQGGSSTGSGSLLTASDASGVGSSELSLLNQMRSLRIDTSFFKDPAYQSLVDYSVSIAPENVGRPNPFAPIPGVPNPNAPESPSSGLSSSPSSGSAAGSAPSSGR